MRTAIALLVVLAVCPASSLRAQAQDSLAVNHLFLEVFGNGGFQSVNYERRVSEKVALRAGLGYWESFDLFGSSTSTFLTLPLTISHLRGGEGRGWEVGGGVLIGNEEDVGGFLDLTAILGYRWVRGHRWVFRAAFTPFLALSGAYPDEGFFPSAGVSAGFTF